jgi:hypothetical protein
VICRSDRRSLLKENSGDVAIFRLEIKKNVFCIFKNLNIEYVFVTIATQ